MDRVAYIAFLDNEIPSIMREGVPPSTPTDTFAEGCAQIAANLAAARFPGRKARVEADRRYAEVRRLNEQVAA